MFPSALADSYEKCGKVTGGIQTKESWAHLSPNRSAPCLAEDIITVSAPIMLAKECGLLTEVNLPGSC